MALRFGCSAIGAILVFLCATQANAMNWCGLPQIVPQREEDFETLKSMIETYTGCARQPSDSAHRALWICPDDPKTSDNYEGVHVFLVRVPGEGIHLIVLANKMNSLDVLRQCGLRDLRNEGRFVVGNVAIRDRVSLGIRAPRLTLTAVLPNGISMIVSDTALFREDPYAERLWEGTYGIKVESYPSTNVKLAGLSPISNHAESIVQAFEARGSRITKTENLGDLFPKWTLSPPVGLSGVDEVVVEGFLNHLLRADYVLSSTADYERYISLLDAEYGQSNRTGDAACTYRWWKSGRVSIVGEHCPGKSDILRFFNNVAGDQLKQVNAKIEAEQKESDADPARPAIDEDMF